MFLVKGKGKFLNFSGVCLALALLSGNAIAVSSTTQYQYDARGRLIQIADDSGREANYAYDDAGNRVNVSDETVGQVPDPVINSFIAPTSVASAGALASLSWTSSNTTGCSLLVNADSTTYPGLPSSGSKSIPIYQSSSVTLTCVSNGLSTSQSKFIKVNSVRN